MVGVWGDRNCGLASSGVLVWPRIPGSATPAITGLFVVAYRIGECTTGRGSAGMRRNRENRFERSVPCFREGRHRG